MKFCFNSLIAENVLISIEAFCVIKKSILTITVIVFLNVNLTKAVFDSVTSTVFLNLILIKTIKKNFCRSTNSTTINLSFFDKITIF